MKYQFQFFAFFLSILAAFLVGCSEIVPCDNQINLSPPIQVIVNPIPVQRNFLHNNKSHKILVAIVDTGVDYNHPDLVDSIHFDLDRNNQPIRLGWDFVGQDGWPCPYLGRRTVNFDFELDLIDKLIEEDKKLGTYFDKKRNIAQEYLASVWHGTSMAGLIVQDNKNTGLLAYRVVPPNKTQNGDQDYVTQIVDNIINACKQAIDDGARIIVMTTFFHFDYKDSPQRFLSIKKFKERFAKLMKNHSSVLFVASAGNDDGYRYSGRDMGQIDFPSGIIAENLLVVGSFTTDGNLSSFSNIPTGDIKATFFPGQNRECIYPQHMLSIPDKYLSTLPAVLNDLCEGNESYRSIASYLRFLGKEGRLKKDGTSFSTALAANACAKLWIENKKLSPNEIINELMKNSYKISQVSF